jgi:diaminopimelate epimerase
MSTDTAGREFVKMQGLRNHFVIVDGRVDAFTPTVDEIVSICDPTRGVGADELVVMEPAANGGDVFMRIYNIDGREVEACGNATRCVAWLLIEELGKNDVVVETVAGRLGCSKAGDRVVTASMCQVSAEWRDVPMSEERDTLHVDVSSGSLRDAVVLNVGNPHAVFFVDDLDAVDIVADAPAIQQNSLFPNEVNVGVAEVSGATSLRLKVYERGVGLTMACGSGTCAAVFAARARGLIDAPRVDVVLPGGAASVKILDDNTAVMTGPVAYCFRGTL